MAAEMYEDDLGGPNRGVGSRKRLSGKKLILFVVLPLLLLFGAAAGLYFSGMLNPLIDKVKGGHADDAPKMERPAMAVYYDLPDILVNLRTDSARPSFLKISVSLELERLEDRAAVERVMPRVIDTFQVYLRELRADQLQGSAGLIRLREELLSRINAAVKPARVKDVLFKEMLVQ
jgi:flagellar FliL protein